MSTSRWRASALITLLASFVEMTWATPAEVVVANIPMIVAKMMGPDITMRLDLDRAASRLAGESWIDLPLPFCDNSCQKRFIASSLCDPLVSFMGPA